jgi:hypothetical protein
MYSSAGCSRKQLVTSYVLEHPSRWGSPGEIRRYLASDGCKVWSGKAIFPAVSPGWMKNLDKCRRIQTKQDEIRLNISEI